MCIIHKGFRDFLALLPASILGGNLKGLNPAIPYEIIHLPSDCLKTPKLPPKIVDNIPTYQQL